ncbi:MAG: 30S ribosomal protein S6 [Hadesarchaea archaeon YNP_N21]|jgi:small subunit ribosomal protein S6e|nr:MAG: 30S ribosomal protein S6 [Hadesarchaea archaeon YNP_N21]
MAQKVVVSDPNTGKSYQIEIKEAETRRLIGLQIGGKFDGGIIGLPGYELEITGGTDKDGFPMRPDVDGPRRVKVLLSGGKGFKPKDKGERRRKYVRGKVISDAIVQINAKIVKCGTRPLEELLPQKSEAKK